MHAYLLTLYAFYITILTKVLLHVPIYIVNLNLSCNGTNLLKLFMWQILAMGLGAVPFLKRLILTPDAPLFFFTDSCMILGYAYLICNEVKTLDIPLLELEYFICFLT